MITDGYNQGFLDGANTEINASTISNLKPLTIKGHLALDRGFAIQLDLVATVSITGKKNRDVEINYFLCEPHLFPRQITFHNKSSEGADELFRDICSQMKAFYE